MAYLAAQDTLVIYSLLYRSMQLPISYLSLREKGADHTFWGMILPNPKESKIAGSM